MTKENRGFFLLISKALYSNLRQMGRPDITTAYGEVLNINASLPAGIRILMMA